jgi:hypothetical protein
MPPFPKFCLTLAVPEGHFGGYANGTANTVTGAKSAILRFFQWLCFSGPVALLFPGCHCFLAPHFFTGTPFWLCGADFSGCRRFFGPSLSPLALFFWAGWRCFFLAAAVFWSHAFLRTPFFGLRALGHRMGIRATFRKQAMN